MTTLRLARIPAAVAILVAFGLGLTSAVGLADGLDYFLDASFPIDALARGDLRAFAASPALMGDFSLFLRAPFVRPVFEQSLTVVYLAGALPCVAVLVAVGLHLRRSMRARGLPEAAVLLAGLLAVFNPGVLRSLHWGHPEEVLAAALSVAAILAALRERGLLAGLLLGLAVATKQWAVIAIVPTLLALSERRLRALLAAGAVALTIALPSLVLAPRAVVSTHASLVQAQPVAGPPNVWWPISSPRSAAERKASAPGFAAKIPTWVGTISHPLIVLLAIPLGWLFWRRRALLGAHDALGLFALLMLARCLLDPWNNDYYHAPFLLALLCWETLARDGWPRMTLFAGAALALTFPAGIDSMTELSDQSLRYCLTYLVWALPLAGWLSLALFAPQRLERWRAAVRARLPRPPLAGGDAPMRYQW
jgi:glycosyl transferase family 87